MASPKITVTRLAYVHYAHPTLARALEFLLDFGMEVERNDGDTVYLRGYSEQPFIYTASQSSDGKRHFLGATWEVASFADLEVAANHSSAVPAGITDSSAPGGGRTVTLIDPLGNPLHFIHGQTLRSTTSTGTLEPTPHPANASTSKPRQGQFRRFSPGPSPVHKVGHYGYTIPASSFDTTLAWYLQTVNLKRSDTIYSPITGRDETVFTHIDLGQTYTDHHAFFLASSPALPPSSSGHIHHTSFETNDLDTQVLGHYHLRNNSWTNCWGVGRHVLGSQVFDYWFDASGNILEHYSDGDLVNEDTPEKRQAASKDSLAVWGPNVPLGFLTGRVEDAGKEVPMGPPAGVIGEVAGDAGGVRNSGRAVGVEA